LVDGGEFKLIALSIHYISSDLFNADKVDVAIEFLCTTFYFFLFIVFYYVLLHKLYVK